MFDLTVAARSIVDDNYAYEVWQMANRYLAQKTDSDLLETVKLSGEEVWLNTKKLRLRRRLPRPKQRLIPHGLKPRKREKVRGRMGSANRRDRHLLLSARGPGDRGLRPLPEEEKPRACFPKSDRAVEPFTTSILDGIDMRETIRNWHQNKIYVRQLDRIAGEVGAAVVIFDEDRDDRYHYLTTWLGEHQNESDMAFYSTFPFDHLVGPGIGRAEYGGLSDDLAAAPHVRRVVRSRLRFRRRTSPSACCWPRWITRSNATWCMWPRSLRAPSFAPLRRI